MITMRKSKSVISFVNNTDIKRLVFAQQSLARRRVCIVNWHPAVLSQTSNRFNYLRQNVEYSTYFSI